MAVVEPEAPPLPRGDENTAVLRSSDGGIDHAPAFLKPRPRAAAPAAPAAIVEDVAAEAPKPRRRRTPKTFEGGDAPKAETEDAS